MPGGLPENCRNRFSFLFQLVLPTPHPDTRRTATDRNPACKLPPMTRGRRYHKAVSPYTLSRLRDLPPRDREAATSAGSSSALLSCSSGRPAPMDRLQCLRSQPRSSDPIRFSVPFLSASPGYAPSRYTVVDPCRTRPPPLSTVTPESCIGVPLRDVFTPDENRPPLPIFQGEDETPPPAWTLNRANAMPGAKVGDLEFLLNLLGYIRRLEAQPPRRERRSAERRAKSYSAFPQGV